MLKREDITKELLEKYKGEKPNSLKEILENKNNVFGLTSSKFYLINSLMNFYFSLGRIKGENITKNNLKYTVFSVCVSKQNIINNMVDIFMNYRFFMNNTLEVLSEKMFYAKINEKFSKRVELLTKNNWIKPFFIKSNIENKKIDYNDEMKKIIFNIIEKINKNNDLLENTKEVEEKMTLDRINEITFDLKEIFEDIIRIMMLFEVSLDEIYEEILVQEILERENFHKTKRHKIFRYSQVDLQLKEILKEEFKTRTSKQHIKNLYPNFDEWFDKVLKEIEEDNIKREILFFGNVDSNGLQIEGIAILKNTEEEKKICYLYISFYEDVENVFEEIYNYLGIETPLITVEKEIFENKYENYLVTSKKERKLKFNLTSIVPDKYIKGKTELIFNEVGKEPIDLKGKSLDEVIKEIIEQSLKKKEETVETVEIMNEETKEDIKN
jgi:hypothetical protein